jgi:DNA-binding beta-propeller fold protein YncE
VQVGTGALRYELVENWEQIPDGWSHPDVAGVCTDSSDNVYLYCRGDHPVMIYEKDGKFIDSWGEGKFSYRTHGMFMTQGDQIFLVDDDGNAVTRHALDGTLLQTFGPAGVRSDTGFSKGAVGYGGPPFNRPTNAALAPSGDVYVSDGYANARIHRFNAGGDLLQSWGEPGTGPGEFIIPHSTWVHADGRVFVADRENDRLQIFSPSGEYLGEWTDVRRPQDIFMDSDGLVYIAELSYASGFGSGSKRYGPATKESPMPGRISIFDADGHLLVRWEDPEPGKPGYFFAPHGIWVDSEGSIYLTEVTDTIAKAQGLHLPNVPTVQKFARI